MQAAKRIQTLLVPVVAVFLVWHATAWAMMGAFYTLPTSSASSSDASGDWTADVTLPTPLYKYEAVLEVVGDWTADVTPPTPHPYADWDWTADVVYTLHIAGKDDVHVRLPYFQDMGPAGRDLNRGADTDIDPADGWVLIDRNFGEPTEEVALPSFILYNKYRGILRYMFFNTLDSETYTYGIVKLHQPHAGQQGALFTFGEPEYFVSAFDETLALESIVELVPMQWCYADFVIVGYDPYLPADATMTFEISGVEETELEASGNLLLQQVLEKTNISGKTSFGPSDIGAAFKTGFKEYKSASSSLDDLAKTLNEKGGFWETHLAPILDSPFADAVPYLSAAAGFVNAFIGGKPKQVTPMKFEGGLEISGHLTTVNQLHTLSVRVPGAPLSNPDDRQRPAYTQPLGIFNIVDQPTMVREYDESCYWNKAARVDGNNFGDLECTFEVDYYFQNPVDVTTNPALSDATIDLEAGFVNYNQPVTYYSVPDFSALTFHEFIGVNESPQYSFGQMALNVTVTPTNGRYDDHPIVITNTYNLGAAFASAE